MATEKKFLGPVGTQQLITKMREEFGTADDAVLDAAKQYADDLGDNYDAAGVAQTKVNELANGQVKTNTDHIGTMDSLETAAKGNLVAAINEVHDAVAAGATAAAVTLNAAATPNTGMSKTYTLKQGSNTIGTIDIPKDMVVQSGSVVTNPSGQAAGTYIKLVLANATNDEIYVNVGTLVDIYTAQANAAQVQLAIDAATHVVSATIVDGSIAAAKLANNAVTTAKIADGNVTKAKLATDIQTIVDNAVSGSDLNRVIGDLSSFNNAETVEEMGMYLDSIASSASSAITPLTNRVKALEEVTYTEITADEVDAMFA